MSIDRYDTDAWSRPLLPSTLESYLSRAALRVLGVALIMLGLAGLFALLSWRFPELVRLAGLPVGLSIRWSTAGGMLVGGAGVGAAVVIAAPLAWGLELVSRAELVRARTKLIIFPLATALLAGGAAALPTPATWPLPQGLGGSIGTVVFAVSAFAMAWIAPRDATWLSGLVLLAGGAASFTHAVGLSLREIAAALMPIERDRILTLGWPSRFGREKPGAAGRLRSSRRHGQDRLEPEGPRFGSPVSGAPVSASRYGRYAPPEPYDPMADLDEPLEPIEPWPLPEPVDAVESPPSQGRILATGDGIAGAATVGDEAVGSQTAVVRHQVPEPEGSLDNEPGEIYHGDGVDGVRQRLEGQELAVRFAPLRAEPEPADQSVAETPLARVGALILAGGSEPAYRRPSLTVLSRSSSNRLAPNLAQAAIRGTARMLLDVLATFGVDGSIRAMHQGPVVAVFEFEPVQSVRLDRLLALAPEISRAIGSGSARVALLPGRPAVMIEVPHAVREMISLRDILESSQFRQPGLALPVAAGRTLTGESVVLDLARLPHALVIGSTEARPKTALDLIVLSQVFRHAPIACQMVLIDPRIADLSVYTGLPHLAMPVVTQPARARQALDWVIGETEERTKRLALLNVRSLDVYNNRVRHARKRGKPSERTVQTGYDPGTGRRIFEQETLDAEPMAHLVVVISELADVLIADRAAVTAILQRIGRIGASVGVHLVAATDRPGVDVLTPEVTRAFPTRLCFKMPNRQASLLAVGVEGAEHLLADSDMLVLDAIGTAARVHVAVASESDIEAAVGAVRRTMQPVAADDPIERAAVSASALPRDRGGVDDLFDRAVAAVVRERRASPDVLQRWLDIDRHHALDLIERMHRDGLRLP